MKSFAFYSLGRLFFFFSETGKTSARYDSSLLHLLPHRFVLSILLIACFKYKIPFFPFPLKCMLEIYLKQPYSNRIHKKDNILKSHFLKKKPFPYLCFNSTRVYTSVCMNVYRVCVGTISWIHILFWDLFEEKKKLWSTAFFTRATSSVLFGKILITS